MLINYKFYALSVTHTCDRRSNDISCGL